MSRSKTIGMACVGLSLCLVCALPIRADDDVAVSKPVVAGRFAIGSANQIYKLAADLEVPVPAIMKPAGVEQMFQFLGAGGFDADRPVAVDYLAGEGLTDNQKAIFYLPVTEGHASVDDLQNAGDKMGDDGAIIGDRPVRRTADYLVAGGTEATIAKIKPKVMLKQMADSPLMYAEFDAKVMRDSLPALWSKTFDDLKQKNDAGKTDSELAGSNWVYEQFNKLDKVSLILTRKKEALSLVTRLEPGVHLADSEWNLPGMPDDIVARVDYQMADGWIKPLTAFFMEAGKKDIDTNKVFETPAGKKKLRQALEAVLQLTLGGEQTSIGLAASGDKWLVYGATQSHAVRDLKTDLQQAVTAVKNVSDDEEKDEFKASTVTSDAGESVQRVTFSESNGELAGEIDFVQKNGYRYFTFSPGKTSNIDKLLACEPKGKLTGGAKGWVDLQKCMSLMQKLDPNNATYKRMTAADRNLLDLMLADQKIRFTVTGDEQHLEVTLGLPMELLKNTITSAADLAKMISRLSHDDDPN